MTFVTRILLKLIFSFISLIKLIFLIDYLSVYNFFKL